MPSRWTIRIYKDALEAIYRLPRGEAVKVRDIIYNLSVNPSLDDAEPLTGQELVYRLKREGFELIFEVLDKERTIRILNVSAIE